MYATLYDFLRLPPYLQARVTHLDLSIACEADLYRVLPANRGDAEEWPGEEGQTYPQSQERKP